MELVKDRIVHASLMDSECRISAVGFFQIIQDAITELMGMHKIDGITVKREYNAFWVFIKTRVKFLKNFGWCEGFTVNAFFSYISAAKICVDVQIKNSAGDMAAYSRTEICALDIATQRIRRLSTVGVSNDMLSTRAPVDIRFTKFDDVELPVADTVSVRSTNIDFSYHTNNTEYVRMIANTYSVAQLASVNIDEMEIIYAGQSHENDVLEIRKAAFENKHLIVIEKSGAPVVKCEIVCSVHKV